MTSARRPGLPEADLQAAGTTRPRHDVGDRRDAWASRLPRSAGCSKSWPVSASSSIGATRRSCLTATGERAAIEMIRHHRLLEEYLSATPRPAPRRPARRGRPPRARPLRGARGLIDASLGHPRTIRTAIPSRRRPLAGARAVTVPHGPGAGSERDRLPCIGRRSSVPAVPGRRRPAARRTGAGRGARCGRWDFDRGRRRTETRLGARAGGARRRAARSPRNVIPCGQPLITSARTSSRQPARRPPLKRV